MSADTLELIRTWEQLPQAQRLEVAAFARSLLAKAAGDAAKEEAIDRWLTHARGKAIAGVSTDRVMELTRGES